jgi:hypothetical protein
LELRKFRCAVANRRRLKLDSGRRSPNSVPSREGLRTT